jgi:shikimate kinase
MPPGVVTPASSTGGRSAQAEVRACSLILIGPMGGGKSSVARELARRTGWRWVDTDRLASQRAGLPIPEIFAQLGESAFRDFESEAIRSVDRTEPAIVATGGGIVLRPANAELLRSLGCVVWLTASEDVLFERISRTRKRPLLETADPLQTMRELLAARDPLYAACAHLKIDTSSLSHAEVAEAVLVQARAVAGIPSFAAAQGGLTPGRRKIS